MIRQKWILVFLIGVIVQGESQDYRLPENVVPDHYQIKVLTDLSDNFFYNGEVSIDFLVKTATNKIVLHSKNLKIFENETKLEEYGKFLPQTNEKVLRKPKEFSWGATEFRDRPKAEHFDAEFKDELQENERILVAEKKKADVDFLRYALYEKNSKESSETSESSESSEESSEEKGDNNKPGGGGSTSPGASSGGAAPGGSMSSGSSLGGMSPGGSMSSGSSSGGMSPGESMSSGGMSPGGSMSSGGMSSGGSMSSGSSSGGMSPGGSMSSGSSSGGMSPGGSMSSGGMGSGGSMSSGSSSGGMSPGGSMSSGSSSGSMSPGGSMSSGGMGSGGSMSSGGMSSGGSMSSGSSSGGSGSDGMGSGGSMSSGSSSGGMGSSGSMSSGSSSEDKDSGDSMSSGSSSGGMGSGDSMSSGSSSGGMGSGDSMSSGSSSGGMGSGDSMSSGSSSGGMGSGDSMSSSGGMSSGDSMSSGSSSGDMSKSEPRVEPPASTGVNKPNNVEKVPLTRGKPSAAPSTSGSNNVEKGPLSRIKAPVAMSVNGPKDKGPMTRIKPQADSSTVLPDDVEKDTVTSVNSPVDMTSTTQHSTTAKEESTNQPLVEPVIQPTTQGSVIPPEVEFPHTPDTSVKVPQESYNVLKHEFDTGNDFLVLHLDKPLNAGKKYRLYLNYQGVLADTLTGFHRVPYVKRGSSKSTWLASTVFQPNEARTAFPCFDEPALKAKFDVTLGHDKKYTALSNMPVKTKTPIEGKPDWQWSEFETTPPMSTYTAAFLISDLEYLTPRVNSSGPNVTYRFWSRPDVLYRTRYAMRIAPEMKNYLESILGVKDVLPKHDFVALPNFISSALENWGLYSFAEKNLLFTSGFSSIFSKFEITRVVGHEIAHMWFGNMVTPRWWDQIWLSEGFSNFFEVLAADHVQPTWDLKTVSFIFSYLKVFSYDALHSSHPLVPKLNHPNDLNEIFDSITYQKGFYLVRMLNYTLGQEAFMNGVRRYLNDNLLSTADENDLWDALTDSAHHENTLPAEYHLREIMHSWTRRKGYPIIDVTRDYDNYTAKITQRRFVRSKNDYEFRDNTLDEEEGNTKWWIPITYTTGSELNFTDFKPRVWLKPQDEYHILTDMPSKSDFVLMNLDVAGLYRVNYDVRNWELIISYMINENSSDISVVNRVQILDDLLDLARAGEISYERALEATSYLAKEKHFLPWKAALSNFDFILRMLRSTDSNKSFKKFIRNMVAPRFEELGFESVRNEPLSDGLNRKQIAKWACKTGVRSCTRKSISLFKKWTLERSPDEHNPIPSNLRSIVYCTAIENGGSKDWQFLWQRYLSNTVTDRTAILYGLGCSRSTRTLRKFLDWSIKETSGIKKQDTPTVFKSVVRNDMGFNLAKTFLRERMGDLKSYVGNNPFYLPQMIESIAAKMNEPADLEELEQLEQAHFSHLRSVPRSFRQATERVRFNINWLENNFKPIQDWLKKQRM